MQHRSLACLHRFRFWGSGLCNLQQPVISIEPLQSCMKSQKPLLAQVLYYRLRCADILLLAFHHTEEGRETSRVGGGRQVRVVVVGRCRPSAVVFRSPLATRMLQMAREPDIIEYGLWSPKPKTNDVVESQG